MALRIPVAHDFNCAWCWIGLQQVLRLRREFAVEIDWRGYEQYPEGMAWPEPLPAPVSSLRPPTPSRLRLAYAAEGMAPPTAERPKRMRTHAAHEAVEHAKTLGAADALVERLYRAHWEDGADLSDLSVLSDLCTGLAGDAPGFEAAIRERRHAAQIVPFDERAHEAGVYNLPTYWIGGERHAEPTYDVLRAAVEAALGVFGEGAYPALAFPEAPAGRPYVFVNMAATLDGKILSGERDEPVGDLGSAFDHATMRQLEHAADAVLIGASTLRATPGLWYPAEKARVVVSASGRVDPRSRFFADAPDRAWLALPEGAPAPLSVQTLRFPGPEVDLGLLLARLREMGVARLLVEGGSELNAQLFALGLVDELFLTLVPKVKLGREVPTIAGGAPLPRGSLLGFERVSSRPHGEELFLRYRRA